MWCRSHCPIRCLQLPAQALDIAHNLDQFVLLQQPETVAAQVLEELLGGSLQRLQRVQDRCRGHW